MGHSGPSAPAKLAIQEAKEAKEAQEAQEAKEAKEPEKYPQTNNDDSPMQSNAADLETIQSQDPSQIDNNVSPDQISSMDPEVHESEDCPSSDDDDDATQSLPDMAPIDFDQDQHSPQLEDYSDSEGQADEEPHQRNENSDQNDANTAGTRNNPPLTPFPSNVIPCSPEEVRDMARPKIKRILQNYEVLNMIILQHEEAIQKRWANRSKSKRKALLLEIWPNMPPMHRPDLALWRRIFEDYTWKVEGEDLDAFIWPNINLEDLCKTEPLLLMLNARGKNPPGTFVYSDHMSTSFGIRTNCIKAVSLPNHFMVFGDRRTEDTYGQLYHWDDNDDTVISEPTRRLLNPGAGLWILEIQDFLYDFLVQCCAAILHDVPDEELMPIDEPLTIRPEPPIITAKVNSEGIKSLATSAFEDLYKAPGDTDFDRIESLIRAKIASAEDHLFALREDPGYLAMTLKAKSEHIFERLLDAEGNVHPVFDAPRLDMFWGRVWRVVIVEAFMHIDVPTAILIEIFRVRRLVDEHDEIPPDNGMPLEVIEALYELFYMAMQSAWLTADMDTVQGLYSSPPIRPYYRRAVPEPGDFYTFHISTLLDQCPGDKQRDDVIYLVENIGDRAHQFVLGARGLVTELELLTRREPATKNLISSWVADQVSNIGIFCECIHQLELFQPWIAAFPTYYDKNQKALEENFAAVHKHLHNIRKLDVKLWERLSRFVERPTSDLISYPSKARPTKPVAEQRRKLEAYIDLFWNKFLPELRAVDAVSPGVQNVFVRQVRRTKAWEVPCEGKKNDDFEDAFDRLMLEIRKENQEAEKRAREKELEKADGKKTGAEGGKPPPQFYEVDKRAFKVFNTLLFDESDPSKLPDIAWNDFVHALKVVGFSVEKLFGSGWYFEPPSDLILRGPILFNEPFAGGKLEFDMMRFYGRRLVRVYGWNRHMFSLAA